MLSKCRVMCGQDIEIMCFFSGAVKPTALSFLLSSLKMVEVKLEGEPTPRCCLSDSC